MGEEGSKVTKTSNFGMIPKGPKGRFPGVASHGWGIPVGAKNKDASWEFIKWSMSKDLIPRMTQKHGLGSVTRKSLIDSAAYKQRMVINGVDTGKLFLDSIAMSEQGYMKYRTVHVYPQANAQINQALGRIISGPDEGQGVAGVGAGQHHRRPEAGWRQVLSHRHARIGGSAGLRSVSAPSCSAWPRRCVVLAVITIAPAIYLVLTSLTPLNLTLPDTAWDFSDPAGNYLDLSEDPALHALGVGPGEAVGGNRGPAAAGRARRRTAAQRRRRRIRELARSGFLIPMVLPPIVVGILWRVMYAVDISPFHRFMAFIGLPGSLADHRSQLGAVGNRHCRNLGVVSVHDADGAGRAADDPGLAAGGGAHRRRQRLADLSLRDVSLTSSRRWWWPPSSA